jgi:glutamyl-tRNA synthetase
LGLVEPGEPVSMSTLLERFDPAVLPRDPWVWSDQAASRMSTT